MVKEAHFISNVPESKKRTIFVVKNFIKIFMERSCILCELETPETARAYAEGFKSAYGQMDIRFEIVLASEEETIEIIKNIIEPRY